MLRSSRHLRLWAWVILSFGVLVGFAASGGETSDVRAESAATPTPYHAGVPDAEATPHMMEPSRYPLPSAEDRATADAMAAGSSAMMRMAQLTDEAATLLLDSDVSQLVDLGQHWVLDAQALRQQAAWMMLSATAADMIHDPSKAHEINAWNLKGNGMAMTAEGRAMIAHGQSMTAQLERLREAGTLSPDLTDQLMAAGIELISAGEALERDGQGMEESADLMLDLTGR